MDASQATRRDAGKKTEARRVRNSRLTDWSQYLKDSGNKLAHLQATHNQPRNKEVSRIFPAMSKRIVLIHFCRRADLSRHLRIGFRDFVGTKLPKVFPHYRNHSRTWAIYAHP